MEKPSYFCVQWRRTPSEGPDPAEDNIREIITVLGLNVEDVLPERYDSHIGDRQFMIHTPYAPNYVSLITMHPGDWLYFDVNGFPVVVPNYVHRAMQAGLATESPVKS